MLMWSALKYQGHESFTLQINPIPPREKVKKNGWKNPVVKRNGTSLISAIYRVHHLVLARSKTGVLTLVDIFLIAPRCGFVPEMYRKVSPKFRSIDLEPATQMLVEQSYSSSFKLEANSQTSCSVAVKEVCN